MRRWLVVFLAISAIYLSGPVRQESDSYYAYATATSIVHQHTLDVARLDLPADDARLVALNGKRLNYFAWPVALVAVPAVVVVDALHAVGLGPDAQDLTKGRVIAIEMIIGSLVTAAAAVLVGMTASLLTQRAVWKFRIGAIVAFVFALGTSAWSTASRDLDEHGPSLLLLAGALYCAISIARASEVGDGRGTATGPSRRHGAAVGMGALVAASYTVRPTDALLVVALGVWVLWRCGDLFVRYVAGGALVGLVWLVVTKAEYGTWLPPYFAGDRLQLHPAFLEALAGNLVSPARGLLVFTGAVAVLAVVGAVLVISGRTAHGPSIRALALVLSITVVGHWVAVSAFPHWWGGYSYGPRFFTDMAVPLALLATPAVERLILVPWTSASGLRRALIALAAVGLLWGGFTHAQAAYFFSANCWDATPDVDSHPYRIWDWSDPQFLAGVRSVPQLGPRRFLHTYVEISPC